MVQVSHYRYEESIKTMIAYIQMLILSTLQMSLLMYAETDITKVRLLKM